jgi:hypothetical protein
MRQVHDSKGCGQSPGPSNLVSGCRDEDTEHGGERMLYRFWVESDVSKS